MLITAVFAIMVSAGMPEDDLSIIKTPTEEVIELWRTADENCRGAVVYGAETLAACASRSAYMTILQSRDVCLRSATVEQDWGTCKGESAEDMKID